MFQYDTGTPVKPDTTHSDPPDRKTEEKKYVTITYITSYHHTSDGEDED